MKSGVLPLTAMFSAFCWAKLILFICHELTPFVGQFTYKCPYIKTFMKSTTFKKFTQRKETRENRETQKGREEIQHVKESQNIIDRKRGRKEKKMNNG